MSHIVTIKTELRDPAALRAACGRLQLPQPTQGKFKLFSEELTGLGVQLPNWKYPVVCDTQTGQMRFDNFGGRWGEQAELDRFLQIYAVCKATIEARRQGRTVTEAALADGSIKLTVSVRGAA